MDCIANNLFTFERAAYQAVKKDGAEGGFSCELQTHHDHSSHPEEEDVVPCLHHCGRVVLQVVRAGL